MFTSILSPDSDHVMIRVGTQEAPAYRQENFALAEKASIFENTARYDCRRFAGGRINTRRILEAVSLQRGYEKYDLHSACDRGKHLLLEEMAKMCI